MDRHGLAEMLSASGDVSDRGEIIPAEQKSKIEMHPAGRNNPCGTKEQDRDASDRGKIILVVKKRKAGMHSVGRNNPCGAEKPERDAVIRCGFVL